MSVDKFEAFAKAVRAQFKEMSNSTLLTVNSTRDDIWHTYLDAFPDGTDPIFRKRTEHDCSCCRSFIRSIGNVVANQNGTLATIWDLAGIPEPYQTVANVMAQYIRGLAVQEPFLTPFAKHGTPVSRELVDGKTWTWNHFAVDVPKQFVRADYVAKRGDLRTTYEVLSRGFIELTPDAVQTVLDLINGKSLYRGDEFKRLVQEFQSLQEQYLAKPKKTREFVWTLIDSPVARFRNTVIGTLVQDLSTDVDLETAVKSFESKVAPQHYKRPTALITKRMIEEATETIDNLGLEEALHRRHAQFSDVSVNSVLFVDSSVRNQLKGSGKAFKDLLMEQAAPAKFDPKNAEQIGIEDFIEKVLPKATSLKVYFDNHLTSNLVSLTAPVGDSTGKLFKWNNDFAWSYKDNAADSIKERVKKAGGRVENVNLRVSLAWNNYDDLDLHCIERKRDRERHIYFGDRCNILDVDMNAGGGTSRQPVENMRWIHALSDGSYNFFVYNYARRESIDVGFEVEIEANGDILLISHPTALRDKDTIAIADVIVKGGKVEDIKVNSNLKAGGVSQECWGLKTKTLVDVSSVILSPNHWDGNEVGNKHWFFILKDAKNPEPTRGIYNEFLNSKLDKHRKVFEILGDKTKCPVVDDQMSGIGVSSTRKDKVTVMVVGRSLNKAYTIEF